MSLTPKQQRFVAEYLVDLNATAAYIRAGYAARGNAAEVNASRLLRNAQVSLSVQEAMKERETRTHITQDRVLQELARIAFFDIRRLYRDDGSMKAPHELDDDAAAVLSGVEVLEEFDGIGAERSLIGHTKKAKVWDKGNALTLAMRHLGMLTDKAEITGKGGAPLHPAGIDVSSISDAALSELMNAIRAASQ